MKLAILLIASALACCAQTYPCFVQETAPPAGTTKPGLTCLPGNPGTVTLPSFGTAAACQNSSTTATVAMVVFTTQSALGPVSTCLPIVLVPPGQNGTVALFTPSRWLPPSTLVAFDCGVNCSPVAKMASLPFVQEPNGLPSWRTIPAVFRALGMV